ncbi:MAG: ACP S-malonyltransferase [Ktedonobacteraceae bacterium]|nr:ACP S-malonyltransferase [Ktedonobacteraceae bacterium]
MTTKVAFLFPGQGSQVVGMGADIFASSTAARGVFETVDDALGIPLSRLCFQGPEDRLRETINAQPAIVTVSLAFLAALQEALSPQTFSWSSPLTPSYTAGHSVGEYAALVATGALDLVDAVRLVRIRGHLMHEEGKACTGGMAAVIGMDDEILQEICREATQQSLLHAYPQGVTHPGQGRVVVANYNTPGQIVLSGEQRALALATELAKARGAKRVIPLSVSGAFHSPVMEPVIEGLSRALATTDIHDVPIATFSNIRATPLTTPQSIREELSQQVAKPVQWARTIEYCLHNGVNVFLEIGSGQALTAMVKRITKGVTTITVGNASEVEKAMNMLREMDLVDSV